MKQELPITITYISVESKYYLRDILRSIIGVLSKALASQEAIYPQLRQDHVYYIINVIQRHVKSTFYSLNMHTDNGHDGVSLKSYHRADCH